VFPVPGEGWDKRGENLTEKVHKKISPKKSNYFAKGKGDVAVRVSSE